MTVFNTAKPSRQAGSSSTGVQKFTNALAYLLIQIHKVKPAFSLLRYTTDSRGDAVLKPQKSVGWKSIA